MLNTLSEVLTMNSLGTLTLVLCFLGLTWGSPSARNARNDDACGTALFSCTPPRLPQTRASLYDSDGHVNMDCSNTTLRQDRECVEGIRDACPGAEYQRTRSRFMNQLEIKEALCSSQRVVETGRDCMETVDRTQVLRHCDLCDRACLRSKLKHITVCLNEHIEFALEIATIYNMCPPEQQQ